MREYRENSETEEKNPHHYVKSHSYQIESKWVENVVHLAREAESHNVLVQPAIAFNERHFVGPFGPPSSEEFNKVLNKVDTLAKRLGVKLFTATSKSSQSKALSTQMFIACDGTVYPCCFHPKRHLGNVFEKP
jgi:MoaA/NifB/PqqE/SkfB family radical SAM enzyme